MKNIKPFFPVSFMANNTRSLVVSILLYLAFGVLIGLACKVLSVIPLIGGLIAWILGIVCGLYVLIGLVLALLFYFDLLK